MVSSPPCFDVDSEVSMVEGMLTLLITLLSTRLHLGNTTAFYSYFFHILKSTNQFRFFTQSSLCCLQSEFQVMGSLACLVNTPVQSRSFAACSHVTFLVLYMEFFRLKWRRLSLAKCPQQLGAMRCGFIRKLVIITLTEWKKFYSAWL